MYHANIVEEIELLVGSHEKAEEHNKLPLAKAGQKYQEAVTSIVEAEPGRKAAFSRNGLDSIRLMLGTMSSASSSPHNTAAGHSKMSPASSHRLKPLRMPLILSLYQRLPLDYSFRAAGICPARQAFPPMQCFLSVLIKQT